MKYFFLILLLALGCTSPEKVSPVPKDLKADDLRILEALHEEPMRMGTKKVQTEGIITTEIWTYNQEHGTEDSVVETLMYKSGKLVSHTMSDSSTGHTFSRQFKDDKVIEVTESKGSRNTTLFLDENEKIKARISSDGKKSECFVYTNGDNPRPEKIEKCEKDFNTAP